MEMTFRDWLGRCPLIAILRGVRPDEVLGIADALERQGIAIIEVPLNSPDPIASIRLLADRIGARLLIGAGTVMSPTQVDEIRAAGGQLIVTPHAALDVIRAARKHGMICCPGIATPTEAFAALEAGADAIKLFPAEGSSPAVLRAMRAVLPKDTMVLPVGGIDAGNMAPWLAAGAAGFGLASSVYKPGDTAEVVGRKAQALVAGLRAQG